jgi:hypothetical protein
LASDGLRPDAQTRSLRRLAAGAWLLSLGLVALAVALAIAGSAAPYTGWGFRGFPAALSIPFGAVGVLVLRRHPRHGLGWVFVGIGVASALQAVLFEYGLYALLLRPGSLPGGVLVAWILNWYWILLILLLAVAIVVFPDGHLPSPRWRTYMTLLAVGTLAGIGLLGLRPGPLDSSFAFVENPIGWSALGPRAEVVLNILLMLVMLTSFGLAVAGLIRRMRRSQGRERQQFKWFVFAAVLMVAASPAGGAPTLLTQSPFIAAMFFMPVAIGIAILRHRLFDIDLIIRRTLAYAVLTGALALIYFGSVAIVQGLVTVVGGQPSAVGIVLSTLAIAALFSPLRQRVQAFIDQRFYRRKYDATRTLAEFGATVRDETDLERLCRRLEGVVLDTMQPTHASLWLKGSAAAAQAPPEDGR